MFTYISLTDTAFFNLIKEKHELCYLTNIFGDEFGLILKDLLFIYLLSGGLLFILVVL